MNSVKKGPAVAKNKKQPLLHDDSAATVGYGSKIPDSFPSHHPRNVEYSSKVRFNNPADNVGPSNHQQLNAKATAAAQKSSSFDRSKSSTARQFNPSPREMSARATYSSRDISRSVSHDVQSGQRLHQHQHQPYQQPQRQHSSMLVGNVGPPGISIPASSGSYDNRRILPLSPSSSEDLRFAGASHDSTDLLPIGAIRRSISNSNDFVNSIILGDEGNSNYFLSELRDESFEVYPTDSFMERDIPNRNKNNVMNGSDPDILLPFGTLSSFPLGDYGNSKYVRGDGDGFHASRKSLNYDHYSSSGSRNPSSMNINSLYSHDLDGSGNRNNSKGYKSYFDGSLL